jgi:YesN/AraC family two-component response regulator
MENVKLVVVEDEPLQGEIVQETLEFFLNRKVLLFDNADTAWQHIQNNPVDIVISDVDMPGMNGLQLLKEVRENFPDIVCVMMSGGVRNMRPALELGAKHFLLKPFNVDDFIRIVEKYVVDEK